MILEKPLKPWGKLRLDPSCDSPRCRLSTAGKDRLKTSIWNPPPKKKNFRKWEMPSLLKWTCPFSELKSSIPPLCSFDMLTHPGGPPSSVLGKQSFTARVQKRFFWSSVYTVYTVSIYIYIYKMLIFFWWCHSIVSKDAASSESSFLKDRKWHFSDWCLTYQKLTSF